MHGSLQALTARHPALARVLPFSLLLAGIAIDGVLAGRAAPVPWDLRWNYGVRSLCALLALLALLPGLPELWRPLRMPAARDAVPAVDWLLGVAVGLAVLALWIAPPLRAFTLPSGGGGTGFTPLDAAGHLQWGLVAMRWAGSTLVVPIAEELFWRSFLMRWLDGSDFRKRDPRALGRRALLMQALVFGLEHELWLAGMLAGLAYGWLYRRCGRLWPAILAHAVTNGLLGAWVLYTGQWFYW